MKKTGYTAVKIFNVLHAIVMLPFACVTLLRVFGVTVNSLMELPDILAYIFAIPFFIGILLRCLFIPYIAGVVLAVLFIIFFLKSGRSKADIIFFAVIQLICILGYVSMETSFAAAMSV